MCSTEVSLNLNPFIGAYPFIFDPPLVMGDQCGDLEKGPAAGSSVSLSQRPKWQQERGPRVA